MSIGSTPSPWMASTTSRQPRSRQSPPIRASGATLIQPCNVYVYGAGSGPVLGPDTPHRAENPLGRLRREMEATLAAAGPRVVFLRAGDFIDTAASGNWLDRIILKPLAKGLFNDTGAPEMVGEVSSSSGGAS